MNKEDKEERERFIEYLEKNALVTDELVIGLGINKKIEPFIYKPKSSNE